MITDEKNERPDFQAQLMSRAQTLHASLSTIANEHDAVEIIYAELKDATLQSWKNGLQAGRLRATKSA